MYVKINLREKSEGDRNRDRQREEITYARLTAVPS